jgi:hypothetical protein
MRKLSEEEQEEERETLRTLVLLQTLAPKLHKKDRKQTNPQAAENAKTCEER